MLWKRSVALFASVKAVIASFRPPIPAQFEPRVRNDWLNFLCTPRPCTGRSLGSASEPAEKTLCPRSLSDALSQSVDMVGAVSHDTTMALR